MINHKPRFGRRGDVEDWSKAPLQFLLASDGKRGYPLAFWVKANTGQIVKKIAALPDSN